MDPTDRTIVMALQQDARISFRDLAAAAKLSPNATAERVRRLERQGILKGYTAIVDPKAAGRSLTVLVDLRLKEGTRPEEFEPVIRKLDVVVTAPTSAASSTTPSASPSLTPPSSTSSSACSRPARTSSRPTPAW